MQYVIALGVAAFLLAVSYGEGFKIAWEKQQAKIDASIAYAHAIDKKAADEAEVRHQQEMKASADREALSEKRLVEYAKTIKTNGRPECGLDANDLKYLGGLR